MKLDELIQIEKVLRELVYYQPGPDKAFNFYKLQNNGLKPLGWLTYEIQKHSKLIEVEIEHG
jgi:hypothetical protein